MAGRIRPFWSREGALATTPVAVALPPDWTTLRLFVDIASYAQLSHLYTSPAVAAVNGVSTLSTDGVPTGGTFKLKVFPYWSDAVETSALTFDESAADVKTALVATGLFATGDITAAGGALPTAITLTWTGVWAATVPPVVVSSVALTGGANPSVALRTTTVPAGNGGYGYVEDGEVIEWENDARGDARGRFLHLAAVTATGVYRVTAYR
jgi:hypothetical protein